MKSMKRWTAVLLTLAMLFAIVACGAKADISAEQTTVAAEDTTVATTTVTAETVPAETVREHTRDSIPEDLKFTGKTVNILFPMSDGGSADQIDWSEGISGDLVNDAVYERQRYVEDRFGITFNIYRDDTSKLIEYTEKLYNLFYQNPGVRVYASVQDNLRVVIPGKFMENEIALKTKYVRDDISGQIIDMIHDSSTTDFAYIYNNSLGKVGHTMRTLMNNKSNNFASLWKANERIVQKYLETLVKAFDEVK